MLKVHNHKIHILHNYVYIKSKFKCDWRHKRKWRQSSLFFYLLRMITICWTISNINKDKEDLSEDEVERGEEVKVQAWQRKE